MLVEGAIATATVFKLGFDFTKDLRNELRFKKHITDIFTLVMQGIGSKAENKLHIDFKIEEVFKKHYGFDAIVVIPYGLALGDFRKVLPTIESAFNGEIIVDYSTKKNSLYMRCHIQSIKDISPKDNIRFKWGKAFTHFNTSGQTFELTKFKEIVNPNTNDLVGYTIRVDIPNQLSYETLVSYEEVLNNKFPRVFIKWNKTNDYAEVDIILKPLDNKEKFNMIPCKPWEVYIGMTYGFNPILLDYKTSPNAIIGGQNGSGKTVGILSGFINMSLQHTRDDFRMLVGSIADKQDLKILTKLPHCDYYAKDMSSCLKLIRYMDNENARRNRMFDKCKKYTTNIFDYNKNNPKNKLPILYFITDEIADFMEEPQDSDSMKKNKKEFQSLFWKLARQGRSAGCWIICGTQRADRDNIGANVKAQMGSKVCFYQPNIASAQTVLGDAEGLAKRATMLNKANREFLVEYTEGIMVAKSLYLTNEMMEKLLKPFFAKEPTHLNLDNKGKIIEETIEENIEKGDEIDEIKPKNEQNDSKNNKNSEESNKNNEKTPNNAINFNKLKDKMNKQKQENWNKHKKGNIK